MLLLTAKDVRELLEVDDSIEAVSESFVNLAKGNVEDWRSSLDISQHRGTLLTMAAHVKGIPALGVKVVSVYKENSSKFGLPNVLATVLLFEPTTGELVAVVDGAYLTAMRTAAGSALATKYLSRRDSRTLGIIGAGAQGRTHLLAIPRVREIKRALVYDLDSSRVDRFVDEMSRSVPLTVEASGSAKDLVENSDVIVTATTSGSPVFRGEWLRSGTHINSIMSIDPTMRELDDFTVSRSRIVVDDLGAALHEAGDLIQPIKAKLISEGDLVSLGEIIVGGSEGRTSEEQITVFKSVGIPSHDVSLARRLHQKAVSSHRGRYITM